MAEKKDKEDKKEEGKAGAEENKADDSAEEVSAYEAEKPEEKKEEAKEESAELSPELEELAKKYEKLIGEIEKLSVIELAEVVRILEKKFGVSAAAPIASAGGSAGEGEGEEKDSYNVVLKSGGDQKINVIKVVREITGLGLKESKDLVEGSPGPVKEGVKKEEAEEMKAKLEEAGATVELQ